MNIIMSKLIRDVVMHWIYRKVWFTTKPFLYLKWSMVDRELSMEYCRFSLLLRLVGYKHR